MSKVNGFGKPLKRLSNTTLRAFSEISVNNISANNLDLPFLSGNILTGVEINNSLINGSVIGNNSPADAFFTNVTIGQSGGGNGGSLLIYSDIVGKYVLYNPSTSTLQIQGNLSVSDSTTFGNLRIINNNLEAINLNGNVNLVPNGTGVINFVGSLNQTFEGENNLVTTGQQTIQSSGNSLTFYSDTDNNLSTFIGDINISSDVGNNLSYIINNIEQLTPGVIKITTSVTNKLKIGYIIIISSSNSNPNVNGEQTIISIISSTEFTILGTLVSNGNTGTLIIKPTSSINLNSKLDINIPNTIPLNFGNNTSISSNGNSLNLTGQDMNLNSDFVNIQDTKILQLGSADIYNNSSVLNITQQTTNLNTRLKVKSSSIVSVGDYNIDSFDRGIEYLTITSGNPNLLFAGFKGETFTIFKQAVNTSDVITGVLANAEFGDIISSNVITDTVSGDPDLFLNAIRDIYITQGRHCIFPANLKIKIGNFSEIEEISSKLTFTSSFGNIVLNSTFTGILTGNKFSLTTDNAKYLWYNGTLTEFVSDSSFRFNISSGSVFIPQNIFLTFGTSTQYINNTGSELNITANGNINLTSSTGSVVIPSSQKIIFGSTQDYISGNTNINIITQGDALFRSNTGLFLQSVNTDITLTAPLDINLTASGQINIPNSTPLYLGTNNVKSISTDLQLTSTGIISLLPQTGVFIPVDKPLYFSVSQKEIKATSTELQINSNSIISLVSPDINITGNLNVAGNITYISSTVTTISDPVIQLGNDAILDSFDRGISYLYNNGVSKKGFFGLSKVTGRFTFIPDAIETNNVFTGTKGDLDISNLYALGITTTGITVSTITGNPDITVSGNGLYLNNTFTQVASSNPIYFGGSGVSIHGNGTAMTINNTNTVISSSSNISLTTPIINIPVNNTINLGNHSISNTSTNLQLTSTTNLNLSSPNIVIPTTSYLYLGNSFLRNQTNDLTIFSTNSIFFSLTGTINIPTNIRLNFSNSSNYIYSDSSNLYLSSSGNTVIQSNLSISGNIVSGTWNASVITTTYGGTGKSSWVQGSVVFANSTQLTENNSTFYWDNTNFRLGLNTNTPEFRLHLQNDHILFKPTTSSNNIGFLFKNSTNNYCIRLYKPQSPTNFNDFIIATGNEVDYLNLLERMRILDNGFIGINASTRNDINERLYVNGNIKTSGFFKFDDLNYISSSSGLNLFSSSSINLNPTTQVSVQNGIPLVLGSTSLTGSGNNLNITNTGTVNITNSQLNIGTTNLNTASGNFTIDPTGTITLDSTSVNIPTTIPLNLGNSSLTNSSNNLSISSTGNISLVPTTNVNIPNNIPLNFGNSSITETTSGDLQLVSSSTGDILLTPSVSNNVFIPDNNPLVFGDFSRRIVSDGTKLNIYGLVDFTGDVNISGDLTVSGSITSVNTISANTDANILIVGQRRFTIINITVVSGTIYRFQILNSGNHYLIAGDTCYLQTTGTTPLIANTFSISNINSSTTIDVDILIVLSSTGSGSDRGLVRTEHTQNLSKDLGIQFKWYSGIGTGTVGAKNGFFGYDESTGRFTFIKDGVNTNDVFSGTKGYIDSLGIYVDEIRTNSSIITFFNNTQFSTNSVFGSNFQITGGTINGTVIGNTTPATGTFSTLNSSNVNLTGGNINGVVIGNITPTSANFTTISVTSSSLVSNLNADLLDNKNASDFVWRDGTQTLTSNWNAGNFKLTIQNINLTSSIVNGIVYSNSIKDLSTKTGFTFNDSTDTLTVPKISGFDNTGVITNVNITSGSITGTNIDVSASIFTLANGQIDGSKLSGTANINITGNASTVTNGVYTTSYTANSILKADTVNTPIALTVPEQTIIGRKTGGSITALTPLEARTLIGVDPLTESNIDSAGGLVKSGGTMTGLLNFSVQRINTTGGSTNVDISVLKNISYISVTGSGTASGTLPVGSQDGQFKTIIISNLDTGCIYELNLPSNRVLFADGTSTSRIIRFDKKGQSLQLFYDFDNSYWILVPSGFGGFF